MSVANEPTHVLDPGHLHRDTHHESAGVDLLPADQRTRDTQPCAVGGHPLDPGQTRADTQSHLAGVDFLPADQTSSDTHIGLVGGHPPVGSDPSSVDLYQGDGDDNGLLLIYAAALDDIETARIATGNRVANLTNPIAKGGKALDPDTPVVQQMQAILDGLVGVENEAIAKLQAAMKLHPLGPWTEATRGIGLKQGARLLAAIGDPYWHVLEKRPRSVSELWAYCGFHVWHPGQLSCDAQSGYAGVPEGGDTDQTPRDAQKSCVGVAPSRSKGRKCNWSTDAKTRALLVAKSCVTQLRRTCPKVEGEKHAEHIDGCTCSPYRIVYDAARIKYRDAVRDDGTPLTDKHKDNRARRYVAKVILRDMWRESKRLHEGDGW